MNKVIIRPDKDYLHPSELIELQGIFNNNFKTIVRELGLKYDFPDINCYLYPTVKAKEAKTQNDAYAHVEIKKFEIFMVYNNEIQPTGPHEFVHLLTSRYGNPNYVLSEGLAEYFEDYWKGDLNRKTYKLSHDDWVKLLLNENLYIPITELFDDAKFWELDEEGLVSYPESGSFVRYLVKTYGMEVVLKLYGVLERNNPDRSDNFNKFEKVIGKKVKSAEEDWLESLK